MTKQRFRSLPLREAPSRVDREQRVIYGVSAAQAVEALGHGFELDAMTLQQIVNLGNRARNGVKSRFTHPGLSSDGMGKHLGRMTNFRVEGDKAIGDLLLSDAASKAPDGDLAGYVMDLAEEDSAAFGMSIVFEGYVVWVLADGSEVEIDGDRPDNAMNELPTVRVTALDAVDVVDEPAANRDGMFSRALWGTNVRAEQMFGTFDDVLTQMEMTPQQAWDYALKYFDARGVNLKGMAMSEEQVVAEPTQDEEIVAAVEIEHEEPEDNTVNEELQELRAQLAAVQEREKAAQEAVATLQREARAKRFQELARGWQGETAAHLTILEALGEGSEAFSAYKVLMSALSEQIEQGALFEELGSNPKTMTGNAAEQLERETQKLLASDTALTYTEAMEQAAKRNPQLFADYLREQRGN